jgi:ABC-type nitrate/sulfonate/bicarbonate transport system substrate-binding protein
MFLRIFIALIALVGACCSVRCETATLRFGQIPSTARAVSSLYLYVAEKQGFFARENVAVEVVQIPGGTGNMVAALDRGEVDVTQTATPYLIQAALNGSPAVAIAGTTTNPIYSLIAKPQIKDFTDLKGKLIGLIAAGRHHLDFDPETACAQRPRPGRLQDQGAGRLAAAGSVPEKRGVRRRSARPA